MFDILNDLQNLFGFTRILNCVYSFFVIFQ